MKTLFKCLFFTLLILKISYATATNYIYTANSNNTISLCTTGNLQTCRVIDLSKYNIEGKLTHMAISPDGSHAYISTEGYEDNSHFHICLINSDTGLFRDCPYNKTFSIESFGEIKDITVNPTSNKFYILFEKLTPLLPLPFGEHRLHPIFFNGPNRIIMCSNKTSECIELDNSFRKIEFIKISPDNRYAYLISQGNEDNDLSPHKFKFYACPINPENGTFNHNSCQTTDITRVQYPGGNHTEIKQIFDMAISKDNRSVYFVLFQIPKPHNKIAPVVIKQCSIQHSGTTLANCKDSTVHMVFGHLIKYPEFQPENIALDDEGKHAYFIASQQYNNIILSCSIVDGNFQNCIRESEYVFGMQNPVKLDLYSKHH